MPFRDDLLQPIPGANPGGVSLRYHPVADQIKEARREELEAPQGDWKATLKTADYSLAIRLAGEVLATQGKDLQIAVWLIDAQVRKDGLAVLPSAFQFLYDLCTRFWDTLHPEIEDGDLEVRAAPLDWLGSKLDGPVRMLPLIPGGKSCFLYKQSRVTGYESSDDSWEKQQARKALIEEGKLSAEEFDAWANETPREVFVNARRGFQDALAVLAELTKFFDEKFGDYSPSFLNVRSAIEDDLLVLKTLIAAKPGPSEPEPVQETAIITAATPENAQIIIRAEQADAVANVSKGNSASSEDTATQLAAIARSLRTQDRHNVSAYLIMRAFRWGEIRCGGAGIDKRMLVAPDPATHGQLQTLFGAQEWDRVLELTEQTMETPAARGWLDLQRYAVKAVESKGYWFGSVADALRTSVRGLLEDLPGLPRLSLLDGTPTADEETRRWIDTEVFGRTKGVLPDLEYLELSESGPNGIPDERFEKALSACRDGRLTEALGILNRNQLAQSSGRGRFRRRVQIAHILVESQRMDLAKPILEELVNDIEKRHLEDWENGEALAYPLSLLYRCLGNDPDARGRLYLTICKLDPARALTLPLSS